MARGCCTHIVVKHRIAAAIERGTCWFLVQHRVPPTRHAPTDALFMFIYRTLKCFHVTLVTPVIAVSCMEHPKLTIIIKKCQDQVLESRTMVIL